MEALGLLQFNHEQLVNAISDTDTSSFTRKQVLEEYNDVFHGLWKLPGYYRIDMDPTATPVQHAGRRVPIPVRDELKAKVDQLEQQEVLAKVTEPTPWISSMVVVRKPNKIRICLDSMDLKQGIKCNHHPIPTIEEVAPRLTKAKICSVVDAKDGFLEVALDQPSSFLTTFRTPFGRYRWLRMSFGISSAPKAFQRRLEE